MSTQDITMTEEEARKILGINTECDARQIFDNFDAEIWVRDQNKEIDDIPNIIHAKNFLIQSIVEQQLTKTGRFVIEAPWDDKCDICKGTGEIYKLEKKEVEIDCFKCNGKGTISKQCPVCHGTKRFKRSEPGLRINVKCTVCNDVKRADVKCIDCRGHKKIKKPVNTGKLASTTQCKVCRGTGKERPKKEKRPFNALHASNHSDRSLSKHLSTAILEASNEA